MLIDCDTCSVRGAACVDCVVTALLDTPDEIVHLGAAELHAIEVLARAGLSATVLAGSPPAESPPAASRAAAAVPAGKALLRIGATTTGGARHDPSAVGGRGARHPAGGARGGADPAGAVDTAAGAPCRPDRGPARAARRHGPAGQGVPRRAAAGWLRRVAGRPGRGAGARPDPARGAPGRRGGPAVRRALARRGGVRRAGGGLRR